MLMRGVCVGLTVSVEWRGAEGTDLRGDLVLIKVGEVLEFGENIFGSGKGLRLTPLPLLSLLSS